MPVESLYMISCDGNSNVFHICHHFPDIHCQNMYDLDLDLYNEPTSNLNIYLYNFLYNKLYHICHSLRDNHVLTFKISQIRFFDRQREVKAMRYNVADHMLE